MKAILEPISHPELGPIVSEDGCMLPIGRWEPPFDGHQPEITAKLSRRHARIFQRGNVLYLAELGSTNGTQVNGASVSDKPVRLMPGDEVCFGGEIRYRLETDADDTRPMRPVPSPVQLTLTPKRPDPKLQPIVVTHFPFVVDKRGSVFARYQDEFPADFAYLSRRHAVIYLQGTELHVEDLSSKNGTFVCGQQLELNTRRLHDGDDIYFGRDRVFAYTVSIVDIAATVPNALPPLISPPAESAAAAAPQGAGVPPKVPDVLALADNPDGAALSNAALPESPVCESGRPDSGAPEAEAATGKSDADEPQTESRTTFVTAADSFLDIFCHDDAAELRAAVEPGGGDRTGTGKPPAARAPVRPAGPLRRLGRVARELKGALADERPRSRAPYAAAAALALAAATVGLVLYVQESTERRLTALMDRGAYSEAAREARAYLEREPDDVDVREIATEALLKHIVAPWRELLANERFADAASLLHAARERAGFSEQALNGIATLQWIGEMQAFMAGRTSDDRFVVFADEAPLRRLVAKWDAGNDKKLRAMSLIARHVPAFEGTQAQALSRLRLLRSQASVYTQATATLESNIAALLASDDAPGIEAVLDAFAEKYPRIEGIERVRQDLELYLAVDAELDARNVIEVAALLDGAEFQTPPFRVHVSSSVAQSLPADDVLVVYREARAAWRAGRAAEAIAKLETIADAPWGDVARDRIARMRAVLREYQALGATAPGTDPDERLLAFYVSLDADEDVYFARALAARYAEHEKRALAAAGAAFERSRESFEQYRSKGGIGGRLRLEAKLSNKFARQARLLSQASLDASRGRRIHDLLRIDASAPWRDLSELVLDEMERQRRSLEELNMVLDPGLVEAKLELLVAPEKEES